MRSANRVSWCRRFLALAFLSLLLPLVLSSPPLHADLFFFKDGFVIEGKVQREMTLEFDQVGREAYYMPKGFYSINDGPRRIFFSPAQVRYILEKERLPEDRIICPNTKRFQVNPKKFPGLAVVVSTPEWNEQWDRRFEGLSGDGQKVSAPQHIDVLTPYWAQVGSMGKYFWGCAYLTRELGPETVQSLLAKHKDFQEKKNQPSEKRASMRLRKTDFFAQSGFLDLAEKEMVRLLAEFPDQKERIEAARKALVKLRAVDRIEEIKRRRLAGQHRRVRQLLENFATKDVPKEQIAKIQELSHEYKEAEQLLQETGRLLEAVRKEALGANNTSSVLTAAAGVILAELNFETVGRLDAFLGQARQAERLHKARKPSEASADQLLSLAVSGWLLGSASAELSVETAKRLWDGRDMLLAYLRTDNAEKRMQMIQRHLAGSRTESASLDELIQIIRTLPPIAAEKQLPQGAAQYKAEGATYFVQLPPEYRHARPYPVLIVLHQAGEQPGDTIKRWAAAAAENGYILLAPEWQTGLNNKYTYSDAEHETLLKSLRDLRRRFNVEDDRVFLFGWGEGGAMAFDVGLGHPDLFAGVLPMGAGPQFHVELCWRNAQYLPFYVVYGAHGPDHEKMRDLFNNWVILRPFDTLWIDYKGRGAEWFAGEVPNMFDWMRSKRRVGLSRLRRLGSDGGGGSFGNEFCTLRAGDNHFYWLSSDNIINTKDLNNWRQRLRWQPASLYASIDRDNKLGNVIQLKTTGIGQVTVWLGRDSKGEDMIDFDLPVTVRHGFANKVTKRKISPNLEVLLEDLYQRGDRQQLFLAKIPINLAAPLRATRQR